MVYKLNKNRDNYYLSIDKGTYQEVIAHSFDGGKQILSLKNCKAIELGYDLEELVEKCADEYADRFDYNDGQGNREVYSNRDVIEKVYIIAFQKALEILGDKKFSEEELVKAMNFIGDFNDWTIKDEEMVDKYGFSCAKLNPFKGSEKFIESLQQTEWEVEVVQILQMRHGTEWYDLPNQQSGNDPEGIYQRIPKLDAEGCLILKRK